MIVPFHRPSISDDDIERVVSTLRSGWLTTGERTAELEQLMAEFLGVNHFVALNSGTAALHLGLLALGVNPGDEVITSTYTFAATAEIIVHCGATPVLADIQKDTLNIDPADIEKKITEKTRAVVPVHIAGLPCDLSRIEDIADRYNLGILNDAAHAVETVYHGASIAAYGQASAYSFYATKNITSGEGGGLATDDAELAERVRLLSLHGLSKTAWNRYSAKGEWRYEILEAGFKYNMPDVLAALGVGQMSRIKDMYRRRAEIASQYNSALREIQQIETPAEISDTRHAWHLYIIQLNLDKLRVDRDDFMGSLRDMGVQTSVHFIPLHMHPYYRARTKPAEFPKADRAASRVISLPLYPAMEDEQVQRVISSVKQLVHDYAV